MTAGIGVFLLFIVVTFAQNWSQATAQRDLKNARHAAKACLANPQASARYCTYAVKEISGTLPDLEKSGHPETALQAQKMLADVQLAMGRIDDAISNYQKLVFLEPQQGYRHGDLARALSKAGRHNEATRASLLAVQLSPNAWQAHRMNGRVLEAAGNTQAAIAAFHQAAILAPPDQQHAAKLAIAKLQEKLTASTLAPNETMLAPGAASSPTP